MDLFIAQNVTLYITEANSIQDSKKRKYTIQMSVSECLALCV